MPLLAWLCVSAFRVSVRHVARPLSFLFTLYLRLITKRRSMQMNILNVWPASHVLNTQEKFLVPRPSLPNLETAPLKLQILGIFPPLKRCKMLLFSLKKDKSRDPTFWE